MAKNEDKETQSSEKKGAVAKQPESFFSKWWWDFCAFPFWAILFDTFALKLIGLEFLPFPFLFFLVGSIPFVVNAFKKEYFNLFLYFFFLLLYPLFLAYYSFQLIFVVKEFLISLGRFFENTSTAFGILTSLILLFLVQLGSSYFTNKYILLIHCGASLLLTLALVLPGFFLSYDPFRPVRRIHELAIKIGKRLFSFYEDYVLQSSIKGRDYKSVADQLGYIQKIEDTLSDEKHDLNKLSIVPKKVLVPIFSVFIVFLFAIVIIGFAGAYNSANKISLNSNRPSFEIVNGAEKTFGLFLSLPQHSTYLECLFHSFTITTTIQDFSLGVTSIVGRVLLCLQIFFSIIMVSSFVSSFFTIIGFEEDFNLRIKDYVGALKRRFDGFRKEAQNLLLPVRTEDIIDMKRIVSNGLKHPDADGIEKTQSIKEMDDKNS